MAYVNIIDIIYPVGSVYQSQISTSPATLFGGSWDAIKNRFLVGAGDTYSTGNTGGEATHTLTVNEMPSHRHTAVYGFYNSGAASESQFGQYGFALAQDKKPNWPITNDGYNYAGGGASHNNLPPYYAVYIWVRTK